MRICALAWRIVADLECALGLERPCEQAAQPRCSGPDRSRIPARPMTNCGVAGLYLPLLLQPRPAARRRASASASASLPLSCLHARRIQQFGVSVLADLRFRQRVVEIFDIPDAACSPRPSCRRLRPHDIAPAPRAEYRGSIRAPPPSFCLDPNSSCACLDGHSFGTPPIAPGNVANNHQPEQYLRQVPAPGRCPGWREK